MLLQKLRIVLGCVLLLAPCAASGQSPAPDTGTAGSQTHAKAQAPLYRQFRYHSNNRRDPFLNPLLLKKKRSVDEEAPRGAPQPGIAGMYIAQVVFLGGTVSPKVRTAVFKGTDDRAYFLHPGDRLFDGYVKSVAIDTVVLTRETRLRSGKVLTQEVTKHLRTP